MSEILKKESACSQCGTPKSVGCYCATAEPENSLSDSALSADERREQEQVLRKLEKFERQLDALQGGTFTNAEEGRTFFEKLVALRDQIEKEYPILLQMGTRTSVTLERILRKAHEIVPKSTEKYFPMAQGF